VTPDRGGIKGHMRMYNSIEKGDAALPIEYALSPSPFPLLSVLA